jgi:hypothetical protein
MAGGMMGAMSAMQTAINQAGANPPDPVAPRKTEADRKKAAEEAKAADQEEKKEAAQEAAYLAEAKKELNRLYSQLAAKRLDLEDAERKYGAIAR